MGIHLAHNGDVATPRKAISNGQAPRVLSRNVHRGRQGAAPDHEPFEDDDRSPLGP
jgi:hypothetical protein